MHSQSHTAASSPMPADIDVAFDFRRDTPAGKDPDSYSPSLRRCHKILWSKALPRGGRFDLSDTTKGCYLHHKSALGEFFLSSDTVIPSFRKIAQIREIIPGPEIEAFNTIGYTIGGMMVFPANKVEGKMTINGARGFCREVRDRFDLTLECIRRHYAGEASPLGDVLERYSAFFDLFVDFSGYVEFFLLQDLVSDDGLTVRISQPFDDFLRSPIPGNADEYRAYRDDAVRFISSRNRRIESFAQSGQRTS